MDMNKLSKEEEEQILTDIRTAQKIFKSYWDWGIKNYPSAIIPKYPNDYSSEVIKTMRQCNMLDRYISTTLAPYTYQIIRKIILLLKLTEVQISSEILKLFDETEFLYKHYNELIAYAAKSGEFLTVNKIKGPEIENKIMLDFLKKYYKYWFSIFLKKITWKQQMQ
jgi:hypothetical protein